MIFRSIRWQLQLWHGLILVCVLMGFGVTAYQLERATRFRQIDQELDERLTDLHRSLREGPRDRPPPGESSGRGPRRGPPPSRRGEFPPRPDTFQLNPGAAILFSTNRQPAFYFIVWSRDGSEVSRSASAPGNIPNVSSLATNLAPVRRTRGELREAFIMTPPGEVLLAGRSIAGELTTLNRFAGALLGVGLAVLTVGLLGGWFLASRVIQPIEAISATAGRIAAGNLSERIRTEDTESELGKLGAVLNDTFARLDASFEQHRQFTADASHELRTPLTVLLSQTQMILARERSPQEYRETLETCQRAAQRMRRLIESLLELARLDSGHEPQCREAFDLASVVREAMELITPLATEQDLKVQATFSPAPSFGDASRISQVVTNLLSNALHYNRAQGEIRVTVCHEDKWAVLEVADTGIGISSDDLPHVFKRFYRADKARTYAEGRTGLGLAISYAIVTGHGGRLEVSSKAGQGTLFTVRLPLV